eukprot:TRINITY_DN1134_c0_g1_i4.p1 TRINITY_DN1134_c0_g1~~TRINITY_DN1134_c0_g1_i4.p1  ORF type:complete len:584 (-),score=86.77 TRINITY_DN1134_c0_g1_i4:61-1812(-)
MDTLGEETVEWIARVEAVEAMHVLPSDLNGKSDPHCVVKFGGVEWRTATALQTLTPVWNEHCHMLVTSRHQREFTFVFEVWDRDQRHFLGRAEYVLSELLNAVDRKVDLWVYLQEPEASTLLYVKSCVLQSLGYEAPRPEKLPGKLHIRLQLFNKQELYAEFWQSVVTFFDFTKTGHLDQQELAALASVFGGSLSPEGIIALYARADTDADGLLSYADLCSCLLADPQLERTLFPYPDYIWQLRLHDCGKSKRTFSDLVLPSDGSLSPQQASLAVHDQSHIHVKDRMTGQIIVEKMPLYLKPVMQIMHTNKSGKNAIQKRKIQATLGYLTQRQGRKYDSPNSVCDILPFITYHNINTLEIRDEIQTFSTFNQFFYRHLKPNARPITAPDDGAVVVSPADSRILVYESVDLATSVWIKGEGFTLEKLLVSKALATEYEHGSMVIARLAPQDYHRVHTPVSGVLGSYACVGGTYYTVNPIAINQSVDVLGSNRRLIAYIESPLYGKVYFILVGAVMVGSIVLTAVPGAPLNKGDEVGYFAFGGSTVLLLFAHGKVKWDADLLQNSLCPVETMVKMGTKIGCGCAS